LSRGKKGTQIQNMKNKKEEEEYEREEEGRRINRGREKKKRRGRVKIVAISKNYIARKKKEINGHHCVSGDWVSLIPKYMHRTSSKIFPVLIRGRRA